MSHLNAGDSAPLFESIDQNGNPLRLQDFKGKKVILYFYPKDDTRVVRQSPATFETITQC